MYRILLVEDDEDLRFMYQHIKTWREYGFEIVAAFGSAEAAWEYLENNEVELVITDIRMEGMDGIELLRKIKEKDEKIPVVLISSYSEFEYARAGLVLGALDYLVKPFREKNLSKVLIKVKELTEEKYNSETLPKWLLNDENISKFDLAQDMFLTKVLRYMGNFIEDNITMENVADNMNLNKDYFGKAVKQHTGVSFSVLNSYVKVAYAKYLIREKDYKNYEISELLGYSSPDYFTRIFKEITGMTPLAYRKTL